MTPPPEYMLSQTDLVCSRETAGICESLCHLCYWTPSWHRSMSALSVSKVGSTWSKWVQLREMLCVKTSPLLFERQHIDLTSKTKCSNHQMPKTEIYKKKKTGLLHGVYSWRLGKTKKTKIKDLSRMMYNVQNITKLMKEITRGEYERPICCPTNIIFDGWWYCCTSSWYITNTWLKPQS